MREAAAGAARWCGGSDGRLGGRCVRRCAVGSACLATEDMAAFALERRQRRRERMEQLIERAARTHRLTEKEITRLLAAPEAEEALARAADAVRRRYVGDGVHLRGLIEFSNICRQDCYYCGIRKSNLNCDRYRLSFDDIMLCCEEGYGLGFRTFVLQGGEDAYYNDDRICRLIDGIKKKYPDCALTLSIGEKPRESYKRYFDCGADRYLLRHETASREHYQKLHPESQKFENRIRCLWDLKEIGCQVQLSNTYHLHVRPGDELIWEQLLPEGHLKEEYTRLAESGGTFAQLLNSDEPVISKPVFCPYRVMGCRVRDRDGSIGIVALVEVEPFRDEDAELLIIICKAVLFEMLYRERTAMQVVPYFSVFKDIIEKTAAEQAIIERCRLLNLTFPKTMQLIAIKSIDLRNSLSLYFMRDTVMHSLPASAYCIIYDESLIIVMDKKYVSSKLIDSIRSLVGGNDTRIGISRPFRSIMDLHNAFGEMLAIQRVYQKLEVDSLVVHYEDIILYHFMEIASQSNDLERFCRPEIREMEEYDRKYGTALKESVETYLESGRNVQRAAGRMNIHKNTLRYRLERAQSLFDLDLTDENTCFNLQFSLRMYRMIR